jgi:hypothetical protein
VPPFNHVHLPAHHGRKIGGPVAERRQRSRRWQPKAQPADWLKPAPLNHGVDEMRCADHHRLHIVANGGNHRL